MSEWKLDGLSMDLKQEVPHCPLYKKGTKKDEIMRYFWELFKRIFGKQHDPILCPDGTVLEKDEVGNPFSWLRSQGNSI